MKKPFVYGVDPSPQNWHQAAATIKRNQAAKKPKGPSLVDRMLGVERLLKDKGHAERPK